MKTASHTLKLVSGAADGFTLIELLLAVSIMATILAAMSSVLFIAFRLNNGVTAAVEQSAPVEQALAGIQRDLANIICSTNTTNTGMLIGPLQTVNQTNVLPDQIGPDFYTTGGQPDGLTPWGDIEKVDYLLSAGTNRMILGKDLVRAVTRNLLSVNTPPQPDSKRTILHGVQNLIFTYYDGNAWQQQWDTTQQTNLPVAIKMQIQMAPQYVGRIQTRPPVYELVIPIDLNLTTNTTSALP
jgi:type II secretion system protein J